MLSLLKRLLPKQIAGPTTRLSWFGEGDAAVSPTGALGIAAFWQGCNILAGDFAKMPLNLKRDKRPEIDHPAYRLLRHSFNLRKTLMLHALLCGNGYAYVDRDGAGRPTELILLSPSQTRPRLVGGKLEFVTQTEEAEFTFRAKTCCTCTGSAMTESKATRYSSSTVNRSG